MIAQRIVRGTLQRYWRLTRGLTMGAQGLIVDDQDRILLLRHTYRPGWHFPGGGVERNETVLTALHRELQEEAGVHLNEPPVLLGLYANFRAFPSDHIALYLVRQFEQPVVPEPNREIAEVGFFARHQLPPDTIEAVRRRLAELWDGVPRAQVW